jgi:diaminopimelate epimerase
MVLIQSADSLRVELATAVVRLDENHLTTVVRSSVLHGNGNVIALVELSGDSDDPLSVLRSATITVCDIVRSVRVDGVLFLYPRHRRGLRMIFFDRDGTWEPMCGNGLRCLTRYAADLGILTGAGTVVTDDGSRQVRADDAEVEVTLGPPRELVRLSDESWFVYSGVPHLVVFLPDLDQLDRTDVRTVGARLRHDTVLCGELGHPEGVHVDFAAMGEAGIHVRTYEVGVEDETSCCGTGVAATGYVACQAGRVDLPTEVHTRGGRVRVDHRDGLLWIAGEVGYLMPPLGADAVRMTVDVGGAR